MVLNGRVGQVTGPFKVDKNLLENGGAISDFTPETSKPTLIKLGIQATPGTKVKINNAEIKVGKTGIYELDEIVAITYLAFPEETDDSTIVDFVY